MNVHVSVVDNTKLKLKIKIELCASFDVASKCGDTNSKDYVCNDYGCDDSTGEALCTTSALSTGDCNDGDISTGPGTC